MLNATIITIGDELLIGQVVDTNSSWIARLMLSIGIRIKRRLSVGDVREEIVEAVDSCFKDSDLIITTGGLGPTEDDITKPVLCEYFGGKLVRNEAVAQQLRDFFEKKLKRPLSDRNLAQADVPDNCIVLENPDGTAPGMLFEKDGKYLISLPGVPHEMKTIMEQKVYPWCRKTFKLPSIEHQTLTVYGIPESDLADQLKDFEQQLPYGIALAYLPNYGMIRLRLTDYQHQTDVLQKQFDKLKNAVRSYLLYDEDLSPEAFVIRYLEKHNKKVAFAESCTGGYLAHKLTALPGASSVFDTGVVVYANSTKRRLLKIPDQILETEGAVSEETVIAMLNGLFNEHKADYGIAVSGIMGPGGGTPEKPVGTVWIAAGSKENMLTRKMNLRFNRLANIEATYIHAYTLLIQSFT